MKKLFNSISVKIMNGSLWLAIVTSFLGCGGCWFNSAVNKTNQQVAIASGEISGENQAAQIDLAAAKPFVQAEGLPPFNAAATELTYQAKDIATLNQQEQAQQEAYNKALKFEQDKYAAKVAADAIEKQKLQTEYDTQNGRWYVVMGKALARWKNYIIGIAILAVVLKGLSVLPPPYGTIAAVGSTVVWSILTVGLNLIEDAIGAIAGAIAGKVGTTATIATTALPATLPGTGLIK